MRSINAESFASYTGGTKENHGKPYKNSYDSHSKGFE